MVLAIGLQAKDAQAAKTMDLLGCEGSMTKLSTRVDRLDQLLVQLKAQLSDSLQPAKSSEEEVAVHAISETATILDRPMHLFVEGTLQQPQWLIVSGPRSAESGLANIRTSSCWNSSV